MLALFVALVAVFAGACGGGGGGDPLAGGPAPDDIRLQPGDRPVRFRLDTAVADETKAFLVESLAWAHTDLGDSGPLTIHVYSNADPFVEAYVSDLGISRQVARQELDNGEFAFESPGGHIWIFLPNFDIDPPDERRLTLFHEYFHTVQNWLGVLRLQSEQPLDQSFVPRWLMEGCAEYLAVHAGAARKLVDEAKRRSFVVEDANDVAGRLSDLETGGGADFANAVNGGPGEAYSLGYLGCERLSQTRGPDSVLRAFWADRATSRDWVKAFTEAFGMSPAAFYADFEAYRATLR